MTETAKWERDGEPYTAEGGECCSGCVTGPVGTIYPGESIQRWRRGDRTATTHTWHYPRLSDDD